MELRRRTWSASVQLAVVASFVAVLVAMAASAMGDVPQAAVVLPVILLAFAASWIRTGQIRRECKPPTSLPPQYGAPTV